jgi:hypothetical protein
MYDAGGGQAGQLRAVGPGAYREKAETPRGLLKLSEAVAASARRPQDVSYVIEVRADALKARNCV